MYWNMYSTKSKIFYFSHNCPLASSYKWQILGIYCFWNLVFKFIAHLSINTVKKSTIISTKVQVLIIFTFINSIFVWKVLSRQENSYIKIQYLLWETDRKAIYAWNFAQWQKLSWQWAAHNSVQFKQSKQIWCVCGSWRMLGLTKQTS